MRKITAGRATGTPSMTTDLSQAPLSALQRVAKGEAGAVEELLLRYQPLVWSIARRRMTLANVEDLVQEVFIELWKSAERFDPSKSSETAFVGMIASRRVVDRVRRERLREVPDAPLEDLPDEFQAFEAIDVRDEVEHATTALRTLRPEEQLALRLSISGLSHSEIAAKTQMPLGTVKSHVRRGLEKVRQLLGEDSKE